MSLSNKDEPSHLYDAYAKLEPLHSSQKSRTTWFV